MIKFEDVSYRRDQHSLILDDINWHLTKGQHWGILGLNGAGKTTLLQLITGYIWPSSGQLTVLGERFGQTSIPELRKRIGWVSAALQYQLKDNDLAEDIVLSGKYATIGLHQTVSSDELAAAKELLRNCGCGHLIGKKYAIMSQGQRQITLVARALMAQPDILILDEPCNGLDLFAREELLQRIQTIASQPNGPTLIFVTHYAEELLPCFSQLLLLKNGQIFKQGPRQDLLNLTTLTAFYDKPIQLLPISENRLTIAPANTL